MFAHIRQSPPALPPPHNPGTTTPHLIFVDLLVVKPRGEIVVLSLWNFGFRVPGLGFRA
jgi:hypothetical protein